MNEAAGTADASRVAESAQEIMLGTERYQIVGTSKRKLRQVDFNFDGKEIRGLLLTCWRRTLIGYSNRPGFEVVYARSNHGCAVNIGLRWTEPTGK